MEEKRNSSTYFDLPPVRQVQTALLVFFFMMVVASRVVVPLQAVTRPLSAYLWWIVFLAVGWGQGSVVAQRLAPDELLKMTEVRIAVTTGLGLGILSIEVFLLGLAGFFSTPFVTFLILVVLLATVILQKVRPEYRLPRLVRLKSEAGWPIFLVVIAIALNLIFVLVPPVFFDAMSYHLELPSRYLQEGRVFHVHENLYSGYPQLAEILFGAGLALDGVELAGMVSLTSLLLTILLLWGWGRRQFGDEGSGWGVAFLILSPPLMVLVGSFHNDWFAAFFTLAAVFLIMEGLRQPGIMILAGTMAGLAAGCKYNAMAFAIAAPFVAGIVDDVFSKRKFRPFPWFLFLLTSVLVASPWYLKNLLFTGDPLYPLLTGLKGNIPGLTLLAADTHHQSTQLSDLLAWLKVPFTAIFRSWELQLKISPGLLPVILLPTLLSLRGSRKGSRYLGVWSLVTFISWYLSFRVGRFLLPLLAVGYLYLGAGFAVAVSERSTWGRALRTVVIVTLLAGAGSFLGFDALYTKRAGAAFGTVSSEDYLKENYIPYPAIDYINGLDPQPDKVLFLGEMRGFYSGFAREVPTFEMPNRLIEMVRGGLTAEEIGQELRKSGFSHVLFNPVEMQRLGKKSDFLRLTKQEESALREFFTSSAKQLFEDRGLYVFELS